MEKIPKEKEREKKKNLREREKSFYGNKKIKKQEKEKLIKKTTTAGNLHHMIGVSPAPMRCHPPVRGEMLLAHS